MNQGHGYIQQEWRRAASTRDIPALIALYADDAILESPLVPVILDDKSDGVLSGKAEIGRFLEAGAHVAARSNLCVGTNRTPISARTRH